MIRFTIGRLFAGIMKYLLPSVSTRQFGPDRSLSARIASNSVSVYP